MNSNSSKKATVLHLKVSGCGHVVSFKNTKMILPGSPTRRPMLITDPKKQKLMIQYERCIERDLLSAYQTAGGETQTGQSLPSWIASSVFLDDSLGWIPESDGYRVEHVNPGEEGMDVFIERLA